MLKTIFLKIELEITTTTVKKNGLKYSLMSEGNTCRSEPNLDVIQ